MQQNSPILKLFIVPSLVLSLILGGLFTPVHKAQAVPIILIVAVVVAGAGIYDYNSCGLNIIWGCDDEYYGAGAPAGAPAADPTPAAEEPPPPPPPPANCPASGSGCTFSPQCTSPGPLCSSVGGQAITSLSGAGVTLSWSCPSGTYNSSNGSNFSTGGALSGSTLVSPTANTTYTLTCGSSSGNSTGVTTITVDQPSLSIAASPDRARKGRTSTVTWSAQYVTPGSCYVTSNSPAVPSWSGDSGSQEATISVITVFTLTCSTPAGSVSRSAIVELIPSFQEV